MKCRGELNCPGIFGRGDCGVCGFNPAVKEKRLRECGFETRHVYHALHNDYGKIIHVVNKDCKVLIIKKGEHNV